MSVTLFICYFTLPAREMRDEALHMCAYIYKYANICSFYLYISLKYVTAELPVVVVTLTVLCKFCIYSVCF